MNKFQELVMKYLMMKNMKNDKKGAVIETLKLVGSVILVLLTLVVIVIAVYLAMSSLQNANIFPANSSYNASTTNIMNNITAGANSYFANIPTIFVILGVVTLISAVILIIYFVSGIGGRKGGL